jgi:hypothetical protein
MGFGTLMPHLLGVPVWDGRASAPEGTDALCPHHMDILPFQKAAWGGDVTKCDMMERKDVHVVRTQGIGPFGSRCPKGLYFLTLDISHNF